MLEMTILNKMLHIITYNYNQRHYLEKNPPEPSGSDHCI